MVAKQVSLSTDPAAHDAWFRAKVQQALDDPRPAIPHDEVKAHFAKRRAAARKLAHELNGELKDDQRSVLTAQTIEHYRQRIVEYERKQLTLKR